MSPLCASHFLSLLQIFSLNANILFPEILVAPESTNTTLNSTATFYCDARGSEEVNWRIDEMSLLNPSLFGRGIVEGVETFDPVTGIHNATLMVPACVVNNGTRIRCRISSFSPLSADASSNATLLIQGNVCTI